MSKVPACLAMLLVFPFFAPEETPESQKTDTLPTIASVAAHFGLGECVLSENHDGKPKPEISVGSCKFGFRTFEGLLQASVEFDLAPDWQNVVGNVVEKKVITCIAMSNNRGTLVGGSESTGEVRFVKGVPHRPSRERTMAPIGNIPVNRISVLVVEEPSADQGSRPLKVLAFLSMAVTTEK